MFFPLVTNPTPFENKISFARQFFFLALNLDFQIKLIFCLMFCFDGLCEKSEQTWTWHVSSFIASFSHFQAHNGWSLFFCRHLMEPNTKSTPKGKSAHPDATLLSRLTVEVCFVPEFRGGWSRGQFCWGRIVGRGALRQPSFLLHDWVTKCHPQHALRVF